MLTILAAAAVYGLTGGMTPGPTLMVALAHTLEHGWREGAKIILSPLLLEGPRVGILLLIVPRLESFTTVLSVIAFSGAGYLLWLAFDTWRSRPPDLSVRTATTSADSWRRGIITNLLNPNPYLFWVTVGTPMLIRAWRIGPAAAGAFIAVFFTCLIGAMALFVMAVARMRDRMVYHTYRIVMRLLSLLLIVFAVINGRDAVALLRA